MLWAWKGASEQIVNAWVVGDHTNPGNVHLFWVNPFIYSRMIEIIHNGNKISGHPNAILATVLVIVLPTQEEIRLEIIFCTWQIFISSQN